MQARVWRRDLTSGAPLWEVAARKTAISATAGLFASAFALGALVLGGRAEGIAHFSDDGRLSLDVVGRLLSAMLGAGLPVAGTVLACLLINDAVRWLVRQLSARRPMFVALLLRVGAWLAYTWAVGGRPIRRILVAFAMFVIQLTAVIMVFAFYIHAVSFGATLVHTSTMIVSALLDDPPALTGLALSIGCAFVLMYLGLGVFAGCLWPLWRIGQRAALRRLTWHSSDDGPRAHR